jgi:hypothetical protein
VKIKIVLCASFLFSTASLHAQFSPYIFQQPPRPVYIPTFENGGLLSGNDDAQSEEAESRPEQTVTPANLRFTFNAAQRKRNLASFVSEVQKVSPEFAPQIAQRFEQEDLFSKYGQIMDSLGLDSHNTADNFTGWWLTAWEASTGGAVDTPPETLAKVQAQVQKIFANDPSAGAMSDADKQKISDDMIIRTLLLAGQIDQAKVDPEYARNLAIEIKKSVKASGMDLDTMVLTPDGFRTKGKKG